MNVTFATPSAALVGLAGLVALAVLAAAELRARRVCDALGLGPPSPARAAAPAAASVVVAALVAAAAAQPVASRVRTVEGRMDAEVFVVFDITRSMEASLRPGRPTRLERARALAKQLRARLAGIPVGVASLTDRALPHLFPTVGANAFSATVDEAIEINRPPPEARAGTDLVTQLNGLRLLGTQRYFSPQAKRRAMVVFTDGETRPVDVRALRRALSRAQVTPVFVHVWEPGELVYERGVPHPAYAPDPSSGGQIKELAAALAGKAYGESKIDVAAAAVREAVGGGPAGPRGRELSTYPLAPYVAALAFAPLLVLLRLRNARRD